MAYLNLFLCLTLLVQAAITAKRNGIYFSFLLFSCMYLVYFGLAPVTSQSQITRSLDDVVRESVLFLFGANISAFAILLRVRSGKNNLFDHGVDIQRAFRASGKSLFWLAFGVVCVQFLFYGSPVFQENINMARHELAASGYLQIFLTRAIPLSVLFIIYANLMRTGRALTGESVIYVIISLILIFLQGFRIHIMYFILYVVALIYIYRGTVAIISFGSVCFAVSAIFFSLTAFRFQTLSFELIGDMFQHRVSFELIRTASYAIQMSEVDGFWYGRSIIMDLQSALPGPGMSFGDYMLYFVNPQSEIIGIAALTPSVVGEAYLNFGSFGVFVFGLFTVYAFDLFARFLGRFRSFAAPLAAFFLVMFTQVIEVGYGQILASRFIPSLVFLGVAFVFFSARLSSLNRYGTKEMYAVERRQ